MRQRRLQALDQFGHAKIIHRYNHAARRRGGTETGAAHETVERTAASLQRAIDCRLATCGSRQIGNDICVLAVNADDAMACLLELLANGGANTRG